MALFFSIGTGISILASNTERMVTYREHHSSSFMTKIHTFYKKL